jgi:hypothetical protein
VGVGPLAVGAYDQDPTHRVKFQEPARIGKPRNYLGQEATDNREIPCQFPRNQWETRTNFCFVALGFTT